MLGSPSSPPPPPSGLSPSSSCLPENAAATKRKRRPAGTPDPDAEVVALSPRTLMESDRYVCEICEQGFRREQNLQMHRRRHKVPWKLLKRAGGAGRVQRKRVFVCPEPSCLHHDPAHALGDLVGIKKHFRRKHGGRRQWVCARCSKAYAVQSDYKAHLKTCGTRGHSCDCGRVFSRVESFIEHQDTCHAGGRARAEPPTPPGPDHARPTSSSQQIPPTNTSSTAPESAMAFHHPALPPPEHPLFCNLELQLLPPRAAVSPARSASPSSPESHATKLQLSIHPTTPMGSRASEEHLEQQLRLAVAEKVAADEAREDAKRLVEIAERELAEAMRARQRAQAELKNALALRDRAARQLGQLTCHNCRHLSLTAGSYAPVTEMSTVTTSHDSQV